MICICVGTRPNFIKAAPIIREMEKQNVVYTLVHTGQHYDKLMSECFFTDLGLPTPDKNFGAWFARPNYAIQVGKMMVDFDKYFDATRPDMVLSLGDVNSSLACALAAKFSGIKLAHVEAGERCGDRSMPEEINRILIDEISDIHFFSSQAAVSNVPCGGPFVGNVMIDQLIYDEARLVDYAVMSEPYAVLTLHRQKNVDCYVKFLEIYSIICEVATKIRVEFVVHPRTRLYVEKAVKQEGKPLNLFIRDPMGRRDFLALVKSAKFVMTDSGGLQVETSYLNVPTFTLRESTEWTDTVWYGSNCVYDPFSTDKSTFWFDIDIVLNGAWKQSRFKEDPMNDGHAAERIVNILKIAYRIHEEQLTSTNKKEIQEKYKEIKK